ncbi:MAG TPA: beta-N-acetylhexosaminidase [Xanthobacteraceae bacterium]|nr:beta-N-acetylhexosaminidase [Xanthobacteraceae bacterium]
MAVRAFITGLAGTTLSPAERAFVREREPWGFIIFKRNVETPSQLRRLIGAVREVAGRNVPVLVDQEGGRVQRLGPPHWPSYPPGAAYGRLYDRETADGIRAAYLGARLIAADLAAVGIDVDCLPVADVPASGADPIIGDRAYGQSADKVSALARAAADGLLEGGVLPVLKHIPGHGRATADSHHALPVVETDQDTLRKSDFAAFRSLSDLPLGMTAHVVYTAIDPIAPATTSVTLVRDVIRGWLGFAGLLMSDDISMGALSGSIEARARAAIAAGCDVILHCSGELAEMHAVASAVPVLTGEAAARADAALGRRGKVPKDDLAALRAEWEALINNATAARRATS